MIPTPPLNSHCERSVAIPSNIMRLLRCSATRNDNKILHHPELNSVSINTDFNPSPALQAPSPRWGEGKGSKVAFAKPSRGMSERCRLMRGAVDISKSKAAFTLAEVLITLGIIGVVAAMTLPSLIHNYQQLVLKNQFKRFYSNFYNAVKYVQATNGEPIACYYWDTNPYVAVGNAAVCSKKDDYGTCVAWTMPDGSSIPANYNGQIEECRMFTEKLMKALNVVKFCENKALEQGCLTDKYRGTDKAKKDADPDNDYSPNEVFADTRIKNNFPVFITADGVLYIKYGSMGAQPVFLVDINGHKGPNKYGYDLFFFNLKGNIANGIYKMEQASSFYEKGGSTFDSMLRK